MRTTKELLTLLKQCYKEFEGEAGLCYTLQILHKREDISEQIVLTNNKYFTTPPTLTAAGEGKDAKFTATVVGSGEAEGISVSINEKGEITITGLE